MTRLTSVYGTFSAHVVAARLAACGFDVQLRGAVNSPYAVTVGEMARVDVYVPAEQAHDASFVLLVDEVDEADGVLDDDRPPPGVSRVPRWCGRVAIGLIVVVGLVEILS